MNATKHDRKASPRERYFAGEITVTEYLNKIDKDKEGDQVRRSIEQKAKRISARIAKII